MLFPRQKSSESKNFILDGRSAGSEQLPLFSKILTKQRKSKRFSSDFRTFVNSLREFCKSAFTLPPRPEPVIVSAITTQPPNYPLSNSQTLRRGYLPPKNPVPCTLICFHCYFFPRSVWCICNFCGCGFFVFQSVYPYPLFLCLSIMEKSQISRTITQTQLKQDF